MHNDFYKLAQIWLDDDDDHLMAIFQDNLA